VTANGRDSPRELVSYLRVLASGAALGQFFDVRWSTTGGWMRQRFVAAERVERAAGLITGMAWRTDVYVGVALRDGREHGGKDAISGSRLLYIECDHPESQAPLESFAFAPSMIVASGSPGHLHIYWSLHELASGPQVESANRRLALALEGDPVSVDIARVLRPPETHNHKHNPPLPVRLLHLDPDARHELCQLTAGLPEDPQPVRLPATRAGTRRTSCTAIDRALLEIPAAEYVRVLAHREPNRAGKVLCPFHDEQTPSLQLYPDGTFYCYGRHSKHRTCAKGGTVFDFAAAMWGLGTKDKDFRELRRRLADLFALTSTPTGRP
jgi:CHC2 zinc finger